jgi:glutathione synthase/RimK-type ligase-like ATP-grasp enzyme
MPTIALVTAAEAQSLDEDLPPLIAAFAGDAVAVCWDDAAVDWSAFDLVLLRSAWDYVPRLAEFLAWCERVAAVTTVLNPPHLVRWNTDKHYLADLAGQGIATVPSQFLEPGRHSADDLQALVASLASEEFVVKPTVGAGSKDAQRYRRRQINTAMRHAGVLLQDRRSVLVQPYLDQVDSVGETALMFFDGEFSHAIRKGPLLRLDEGPTEKLFAPEEITARQPTDAELGLAKRVVAAIPGGAPLYARVDLLCAADGSPCVLELELTEPSLFFPFAIGSAERYVIAARKRLAKP